LNAEMQQQKGQQIMARRKTPEDLEWEQIFDALQFGSEPDPKYIKQAVIRTKTGRRFKLNGYEFVSVMEQERQMDPEEAVVASCKITLDFQKIRDDVTKFATSTLNKSARRWPKSRSQLSQNRKLKAARPGPATAAR
jgi:hypothetical protein